MSELTERRISGPPRELTPGEVFVEGYVTNVPAGFTIRFADGGAVEFGEPRGLQGYRMRGSVATSPRSQVKVEDCHWPADHPTLPVVPFAGALEEANPHGFGFRSGGVVARAESQR